MASKPRVEKFFFDEDKGYAELATRFSSKGANVFVGFLQSSGKYKGKPPKERGKGVPPSITVAAIAAVHEFGSADGKIPQRSFMGSAIDENEQQLTKLIGQLSDKVILGRISITVALGVLGQKVKDLMRAKIQSGLSPGLKPATLRAKGAGKSKPLIDTGQLLGSISFQVRKK